MNQPGATTHLFYDLETTGLNHAFDQVLQFAAIRTDLALAEIDRVEILVKLRPDVVPSPAATMAHCITPQRVATGKPEVEAIRQIHALLNEPGTMSLGYNTLRFDDEFLRFAFYRNLLPPYTHQYANGCGRMDLLPIVTMYWLYCHDALVWPEIDGKVSLKLENLKEANNLTQGVSHDALVDVEASVALARVLADEVDVWTYVVDFFNKGVDRARIEQLERFSGKLPETYRFGLLVDIGIGAEHNFQAPVLHIGTSDTYRNQSLWLRLDREELQETTSADVSGNTWVLRKKFGEPGIILPPKTRYLEKLREATQEVLATNKSWLEENPDILQEISRYYQAFRYESVPDADVDTGLYQSDFLSDSELELCKRFHLAPLEEKVEMVSAFDRPELRQLGVRLLYRNYGAQIGNAFASEIAGYRYQVNPVFEQEALVDYRCRQKLTPSRALAEIRDLKGKTDLAERQQRALAALEQYLLEQFPEAAMR